MALQNGSGTVLRKLGPDALNALNQMGLSAVDPTLDISSSDPGNIVPSAVTTHTFSELKAGGLSDDQAMAKEIALGGTLVVDQSIHLTCTFTITKPMQFISTASQTVGGFVITSSSVGGLFLIAAPTQGAVISPVLFQGLNIINLAASGSIITMSGDHTAIRDCQFANVAGNSSSMVKFQGYDQVIENSTFSNYEPTAYSWDANWVDGYDGVGGEPVNDRIVGGSALGPGKGGLIENAGFHFTEGFSIDDWTCATQGVQVQASDVYSLEIRGGIFAGATGSAIVLGGGNALVQSVVIQGTYISAAGVAIDAAPSSGSGINDLTVQDNQISSAGTGIAVNDTSGHATLIGNTITSSSLGLSIQNPASQVTVIDNTVNGGGVSVADNHTKPNQVYFGNTINGSLTVMGSENLSVVFTSNTGTAFTAGNGIGVQSNTATPVSIGQAVQTASTNVNLPNFTQNSSALATATFSASGVEETFSHFKNPTSGIVLTDDQAFAAAVTYLGAVHGTLVVDNNSIINLTHAVNVTSSMNFISAGSGLDTSSVITITGAGDIFHISTPGSVLIQGLNFQSGASGSIITTGAGNTVLRDDGFTNIAGNTSPMVLLQGPNQLIQDSYFQNNEAAAYDWSAAYITPSTATDKSTTVNGGWAYGLGKGGIIGGDNAGLVIQGFNIDNWTIVGKGATQIEADNVTNLDIQGGVFDGSSGSAIVLGGGANRINTVTVNGAFVSAAAAVAVDPTTGIGINAGLLTGGGVANLTVTDNQINTVGTGVLVGAQTGNVTISGNDLRTGKVGLDLRSPTGAVVIVGNQDNPDSSTMAVQTATAIGSTQTFVANTFNGAVSANQTIGSNLTFLDNIGSGTSVNAVEILTADPNATIASATATQIAALPTTVITALTSSQIAALTNTQIDAFTPVQISALTPTQVGEMTSTSVAALTTVQVMALTTAQIGALTPTQVSILTTASVDALTTTQVCVLTSAQIRVLTTAQIGALTTAEIGGMSSTSVSALTTTQVGALTTTQLHALSPLQMIGFAPSQLAAMSTGQLETLTNSQFGQDYLFDANYYLAQNPDVAAAGVDPYQDYMTYGWKEGLNPSPFFNTNYYLAENPNVRAAGVNPLAQFEISGWSGGTDPSVAFSDSEYLAANPDVAAAKMDPLLHYMISGRYEGRVAFASTSPVTATSGVSVYGQGALNTASLLAPATLASAAEQGQQLVIEMSETAWQGNATFSLTIDGVAVKGTFTTLASHAAGQSQAFTIAGAYAPGPHTVAVTFLNSVVGADSSRALFVDAMTFNGQDTKQSASMTANETTLLSTTPTTVPTAMTVNLSENAFQGDAMAFISIDGKIQGGVQTVTASHSTGASQAMSFLLDLAPGAHTASVALLNGINGNSQASRNLFIDSIDVAGAHFASAAASLGLGGSSSFTFTVQPVHVANGSLYVTAGAPTATSFMLPSI